jgi:uncharacterized protein
MYVLHMSDQRSSILIDDPVLLRFRKALDEAYGDRLERVVLYGSRARGDARPDSDYDFAVFLRDMDDRFAELYRLAHLSSDIIDETGEFVHAMPYRAGSYEERTPLMREIRFEGIDL